MFRDQADAAQQGRSLQQRRQYVWQAVGEHAVWSWRKALGVGRMDTPGSRRLILAACELGAEQVRGVPLSAAQVEQRRQTALAHNLGEYLRQAVAEQEDRWTAAELALLGTMPDEEVASRTGRTVRAVRIQRCRLGINNPFDRRRRQCRG